MVHQVCPRRIAGWQFFNENVEKSADVTLMPLENLGDDNRKVAELFSASLEGCRKVIDIGCGGGFPGVYVSYYVGELIGIEAASNVLAVAESELNRLGIANAFFELGNATDMAYQSSEFDGAMLCGVLESMDWPDVERVMSEVVRVLEPGGRIVVLDQDWGHIMDTMPMAPNRILFENGKLTLRTVERYQQPPMEKTTWYQVDTDSRTGKILLEELGTGRNRVATLSSPDDFAGDIIDAWYDESAQFDSYTFQDLLFSFGFRNIQIDSLHIWDGILFATAEKLSS